MKSLGLTYPFGKGWSPEGGSLKQVVEGVYWLRMPLAFKLDHINLWLLEDGDGWTLVDTGVSDHYCQAVWQALFAGPMAGRPVKRVLITHMHPDHIGLAGWLTREFNCPLWISQKEYRICQRGLQKSGAEELERGVQFFRAAGCNEEALHNYRQNFGLFARYVSTLPADYRCLTEGETLQIGQHQWQVIVGTGHSPEQCTFHCDKLKLLISGDQVLPRISSNISIRPEEEIPDPLSNWLDSCRKFKHLLPEDTLVLPSHQEPFHGLHSRLDRLIRDHEQALDALLKLLATPKKVVECFKPLFQSTITTELLPLAVGETLAHLHYLEGRGLIVREADNTGVDWYRQRQP